MPTPRTIEYSRGVELIYQRMAEALKKLGLEPIAAEGKPFDYNIHHAIEMVEDPEVEDHTVLAECSAATTSEAACCAPPWCASR